MDDKEKPMPDFLKSYGDSLAEFLMENERYKKRILGEWPEDESKESIEDTNHVHLDDEISETISTNTTTTTTTTEDMEGVIDWATVDGVRNSDVEYDGDTMPEDKFDTLFKAGLKASKRDIEAFASFLELREKGLTMTQLMRKVVQVYPRAISSTALSNQEGITVVNIIEEPRAGIILYHLYIDTDTKALININTPNIKDVMGKPQQVLTTVLHKLAGYNIKIKEVE